MYLRLSPSLIIPCARPPPLSFRSPFPWPLSSCSSPANVAPRSDTRLARLDALSCPLWRSLAARCRSRSDYASGCSSSSEALLSSLLSNRGLLSLLAVHSSVATPDSTLRSIPTRPRASSPFGASQRRLGSSSHLAHPSGPACHGASFRPQDLDPMSAW
jgi:hypothetical protein